ncbi:hypothetical protein ACF1BN_28725 [Streptomyces sp. NPDC014861]|uniref:hypothetical protein n=1 Tax=Streptomyces sp. NPDC014861 TaxID=3364923 RepID=UPI0036FBBAD0
MRTALRTALAAALVAGVAATPVLAAGSAFAAGTTPAPKPAAAAPASKPAAPAQAAKPAATTTPAAKPASTTTPDGKAAAPAPGKAAETAGAGTAEVAAPTAAPLRTVQLAGGLSAEVYARGDQHPYHSATVLKGGTVLGELKAGAGHPPKETKVFAGYAVTLDSTGEVSAVAAATTTGTPVRTQTLIGGTVAKIYKVKAGNHRAELFRDGHPVGVLKAYGISVAGQDNGEFFVLDPDGTTHNWVGNVAPNRPGIYRLADGTVVELQAKNGSFGLRLIDPVTDRGGPYAYANGERRVLRFGGAVVVLEADGQFAAHIPGSAKQAAPQPYGMGGGGQGEETPVDTDPDALGECTVTRFVDIGAGTGAKLIMSPEGPKAKLITAGDDKLIAVLDRARPSLPKDAGIIARIVDAHSATPSLYTKTQGGDTKGGTHAFPKLPKGCALNAAPAAQGGGTSARGEGATPQGGQTSVVPKGGVAAGAELAAEEGPGTLVAVGAAASLAAAGLGFTVLRRRSAATRG